VKKVSKVKPYAWFVAAGTGGHIFPGLNLARALGAQNPGIEFLFFGTRDRLEARLVPKAGFPIRFLSAGRWKGTGLLGRLLGFVHLGFGFFQSCAQILRRRPDFLVSVGGYVSFPLALACRLFGVPVYLLEPNIRAGLANRVISRWAHLAFSTPGSDSAKVLSCPVVEAGNPIREDLRPVEIRERAHRVLVLGGSQGARSLCRVALKAARELDLAGRDVELVLQTGEANLAEAQKLKTELGLGSQVQVLAFIDDVPASLVRADFVMARAGAMTVAELAAAGLPTLFVPFPFAADDHQRVNAEILAKEGAALCVDEREENFEGKVLAALSAHVLDEGNLGRRQALSAAFLAWSRPRAAHDISQRILAEARA
jgi:UDP-N-acetylglucosamine--N-acetylmuramyl-(pentapeptide) pyrophosphoryl-undecaprenol N-acetylglucosamine transferase